LWRKVSVEVAEETQASEESLRAEVANLAEQVKRLTVMLDPGTAVQRDSDGI
jgi:hypothetical protein